MIEAAEELGEVVGIAAARRALGVPRSSLYDARIPPKPPSPRPTPERALSVEEKRTVRMVLNSERFQDCSPRETYGTLLDEAIYYCHWRTMYRILAEHGEVRERRNQRQHPQYSKPQLVATGPNQLWSWDITRLLGPAKWVYYYLYVILDVFSRYVVGCMIAQQESAELASKLIAETAIEQEIEPHQLTLHMDRGGPMRAKTFRQLLVDLKVAKSYSRPHTPTDNPYSEAQFETTKYHPHYPERFGSPVQARDWGRGFFQWYNHEHHHTNLGLMTPATVHYGQVEAVLAQRQQVLDAAYAAHPERFVRGRPTPPQPPRAVWINPPSDARGLLILSVPASSEMTPGAQAGSRAKSVASLDAAEHLAINCFCQPKTGPLDHRKEAHLAHFA